MKILISALALAVVLANAASATKLDLNDHHFERRAHVEVLNGDHSPVKKGK